jgi:hypothetical protein
MWTLILMWAALPNHQSAGTTMTPLSVPNFETRQACSTAYNALKTEVTWGQDVNLVGLCVSSR